MVYNKLIHNNNASGYAGIILITEIFLIGALIFGIYMMVPRYGNFISPIKAITYQIVLGENEIVIKENKWAVDFIIPVKQIVALTYNGHIIFKGDGQPDKFAISKSSKIKFVNREFIEEIFDLIPDTKLYQYSLNLAFIDNYKDLQENLCRLNPKISIYTPEFTWDDED